MSLSSKRNGFAKLSRDACAFFSTRMTTTRVTMTKNLSKSNRAMSANKVSNNNNNNISNNNISKRFFGSSSSSSSSSSSLEFQQLKLLNKQNKSSMKLTNEYQKLNETMQNFHLLKKLEKIGKTCFEVLTVLFRHLCWILSSLRIALKVFRREYRTQKRSYSSSQKKMSESLGATPEFK